MKGRGIKVLDHLVKEISWPLLVPTVQCCGESQTRPHSGCSVWRILVLAPQPWLSSTHLSPHYFVIHSHHNSIINNTQKMAQENDYGDLGWPGTQGHTSFPVTWINEKSFSEFCWKGARWWSVVVNIFYTHIFIEFKYFYLAVINIKVCRDHSLAQHILRHAAVAALVILL